MRIRTLAFSYMAALGLLAIGGSAFVWSRNWMELSDIREASELIDVLRPTIKFVEALALERGVYNQVLVSKATGASEGRRLVAERNAAVDALFAQTLAKTVGLPPTLRKPIEEPIAKAEQIVRDARSQVAALIEADAPASPEAAGQLVRQYVEAGGQIDRALGEAERNLSKVDRSLGKMLEISRLSNDLREQAGLRSTLISRFAGTQKPFAIPERVQIAEASGALQITWRRLQRIAAQVGGEQIQDAVARVRSEFFEKGEPIYTAMINAGRDGSAPPMDFLTWRKWTVARLTDSLAARDAPIEEVSVRLSAMRADAIRSSAIGLATIAGLFFVLLVAGLIVERRVLRPIGTLTEALDAFFHADSRAKLGGEAVKLAERYLERDDEIGSLARAVDRFRTYAGDLEILNQRFDTVLANLPQGIAVFDERDDLVVANRRYAELYGLGESSPLIGLSLSRIAAKRESIFGGPIIGADEQVRDQLRGSEAGQIATCSAELPNGRILSLNGVRMPGGGWLATHLDITERRRAESQLSFMADHDALTGLANRSLFARELEMAWDRTRLGDKFAVMCLDLDRFKTVNDTLGHAHGDELLKQVGQRLRACLRPADPIARLGGDEFAILVDAKDVDLAGIAERIIQAVDQPYELDGQVAEISVSIGIAIGPADGAQPRDLLRSADLAMYRAKLDGRGGFRFFEPDMDAKMQLRRLLELDMRAAIARGEFELYYQPIVNLERNEIASFEALLRWNHPTRGSISPADFIPLAEDSAMIVDIGNWVLRRACADAMNWPKSIKVSVNLSPRQFNSGRLLADIVGALRDSGLPANRLDLEITERVMLVNTEATVAMLHQLRTLGASIAMDDFGTGYSSLSYLRRFPFDKIKIDQTFVRDITRDPDSVSIVRAVAGLAAGLHMSTTAEGVETQEQLDRVRAEGCTEIQGYFISRPIPVADIPALLGMNLSARTAA